MNRSMFVLSGVLVLFAAHAEAARLRLTVNPASAADPVCVYAEGGSGFVLPPRVETTNATGRADFEGVDPGDYFIIASDASSGEGGMTRINIPAGTPAQAVVSGSVTLDTPGLRCVADPQVSGFVLSGDPPQVGAIGFRWTSTPVLASPVSYCAKPARNDGSCEPCEPGDWLPARNRGDGLEPTFVGSLDIEVPGKYTVCLSQKVGDVESSPVTEEVVVGFRVAQLLIDGGNQFTSDNEVSLLWRSNLAVELDTQYRASENETFAGANWKDVVPAGDDPGIFAVEEHAVSSGLGTKTIHLQMRLDGQNGTATNVVSDQIMLIRPPINTVNEDCTIDADELFTFAGDNGWGFETTNFGNSECFLPEVVDGALSLAAPVNSGCGFRLFTGRELNAGWHFVGVNMTHGAVPENAEIDCHAFSVAPPSGQDGNAALNIHVLALPLNLGWLELPPPSVCRAVISSIVLNGPDGMDCLDAYADID